MKAVGTKVLKDNLSKYLRLVREGEVVYVTDRDTVVAEIHRPTRPVPPTVSRWEAFLNDEELRGSIRRPRAEAAAGSLAVLKTFEKPKLTAPQIRDILDDAREG